MGYRRIDRTGKKGKLGCAFLLVAAPLLGGGACIGACEVGNDYVFSEGDRVGVVTKFSQKGIFTKTWEGTLATDSFRSVGDGAMSNAFDFHVRDEEIAQAIKEAQENGARIKLTYNQTLLYKPWERSSSYVIDSVKEMPSSAQSGPKAPGH